MKTLLCVEDDMIILKNNRIRLTDDGYAVLTAKNLAEANKQLSQSAPDAIILDIMLPDGNGLDYLTQLRANGNNIPVLLLTAWGKPSDVARGLRMGANDYLSKPFEYDVLLARVETMFRNVGRFQECVIYGELSLDMPSARAFFGGEDLGLKPTEFSLLLVLVKNEGKPMSAEQLYQKAWSLPLAGDKNALYSAVSRLRKRIDPIGYDIVLDRSDGYYFVKKRI